MGNFDSFVFLLGYRDLGAFHKEQIERLAQFRFLTDKPIRRLWLWARGFFKTSLITEAHTIWLIVNNPDIRILIVSFSLEVAKMPLKNIRNHFIQNEDFRYFFREFCPKATSDGKVEFGTTEYFTIPCRTKQLKEPTVMCAGVGTNITGLHFDVIKPDDLVNRDSVTNDTQLQASKDYYSLLRPIFDNPSIPREDVVGTIYHFNDLHSELREHRDFEKSIIPVYDSEGTFAFPERLGKEQWERFTEDPSISPSDLQRQWLLRPVNPKDAKFKEEWIKYYDTLPEGLAEYICVDPASTQKKKSDYTVIERWGVDSKGAHHLLEGLRDKLTSFQRIDALFRIVRNAKNLKWVKYEVLGGRHGDLEVIKERMVSEKLYFVIRETKSTSSSKADRIEQRLCGPYNAGAILWPRQLVYRSLFDGKTHDFVQEMKLEILQFPFVEHDDAIDCQSQMFEEELVRGNKPKTPEVKQAGMTADQLEKLYKDIDRFRSNPFATEEWIHTQMVKKRIKSIVRR